MNSTKECGRARGIRCHRPQLDLASGCLVPETSKGAGSDTEAMQTDFLAELLIGLPKTLRFPSKPREFVLREQHCYWFPAASKCDLFAGLRLVDYLRQTRPHLSNGVSFCHDRQQFLCGHLNTHISTPYEGETVAGLLLAVSVPRYLPHLVFC